MFRTILAAITITALLLCPLRCSATGLAEEAEVKSGCSCCQPISAERPAQSSDRAPADDCECANCLCHGAVLESGITLPTLVAFPFPVDRPAIEVAPAMPLAVLTVRNIPRGCSLCLNGRTVCILQQSLQI